MAGGRAASTAAWLTRRQWACGLGLADGGATGSATLASVVGSGRLLLLWVEDSPAGQEEAGWDEAQGAEGIWYQGRTRITGIVKTASSEEEGNLSSN